jgi:hypothetical protein
MCSKLLADVVALKYETAMKMNVLGINMIFFFYSKMSQEIIDINYYLKGKESCEILNKKVNGKNKGKVNIKRFFFLKFSLCIYCN